MGLGLYASAIALLSTLATAYLTYADNPVGWLVILIGGFVSGLLYGLAYRFKGLLLSLMIAVLFGLGVFAGIATRPYVSGGEGLLAGLRFIVVPIAGAAGLITSLIGGIVGALAARRRPRVLNRP